jgi:hypothetical protein
VASFALAKDILAKVSMQSVLEAIYVSAMEEMGLNGDVWRRSRGM